MRALFGLSLLLALWSPPARAQSASAHTRSSLPDASETDLSKIGVAPPEFENRPRSPFENALMGEIACTCGTCGLEPVNTCACDFAAKVRGEVLAELDRHDTTTDAGRRAAAEAVRAAMVAKYGPKALRHPPNLDAPVAAVAALVVLGGGALIIRKRRRAGRPGPSTS
jgi:hypothetical protein